MFFVFIIGGVALFSFLTFLRIAEKSKIGWLPFIHFPLKAFTVLYIVAYDGLKMGNYLWLYNFSIFYLGTLILVSFIEWVVINPNNKNFSL